MKESLSFYDFRVTNPSDGLHERLQKPRKQQTQLGCYVITEKAAGLRS
jgi:hypothetical protein